MKNILRDKEGKLQKIILIVLLGLLIPLSVIATENLADNSEIQTATADSESDVESSAIAEETPSENSEEEIPEEEAINEISNEELIIPAENLEESNNQETLQENSTQPEESSYEEISEENSTNYELQDINETPSEESSSIILSDEESEEKPELKIQLNYPEKITRGELIELAAIITNSGSTAEELTANWIFPKGFEIISGSSSKECGNLGNGNYCTSEITIQTSASSLQGINEIKILLSYENESQ